MFWCACFRAPLVWFAFAFYWVTYNVWRIRYRTSDGVIPVSIFEVRKYLSTQITTYLLYYPSQIQAGCVYSHFFVYRIILIWSFRYLSFLPCKLRGPTWILLMGCKASSASWGEYFKTSCTVRKIQPRSSSNSVGAKQNQLNRKTKPACTCCDEHRLSNFFRGFISRIRPGVLCSCLEENSDLRRDILELSTSIKRASFLHNAGYN